MHMLYRLFLQPNRDNPIPNPLDGTNTHSYQEHRQPHTPNNAHASYMHAESSNGYNKSIHIPCHPPPYVQEY
jgi:hypothetical protein